MKKFFSFLFICYLVFIQIWFFSIMTEYPYYGINVERNASHQWVFDRFDVTRGGLLDLRHGDLILLVDGQPPDRHSTMKWGVLEKFKSVSILRNGQQIDFNPVVAPVKFGAYDYTSVAGELLSLGFALLVYRKLKKSKSAKLLTLVFAAIGNIFISLGSNARGDTLAKITIFTLLAALSFLFMHFLTSFFKEKGFKNIRPFPYKIYYTVVLVFCGCQVVSVLHEELSLSMHPFITYTSVLLFVVGMVQVFTLLTRLFFKYRSENSFEHKIINTIWISLCISFVPLVLLTILPDLLHFQQWIYVSPDVTGWFVLVFPASFAYLIMTRQLYDIDVVLKRVRFATLLALLPSLLLLAGVAVLAQKVPSNKLVVLFLFFVVIQTFVLYSTEYFTTKLEPVLYPRKHVLQKALKKISQSLRTVFSFRELKETVLVDIVGTLQVHGGAIAFRYPDSIETIAVGEIGKDEVEQLLAQGVDEHPHYTIFEINRHEDYASYMIMTRKKTNTMLGQEETQWLSLIISYLAVSLENVHLIRKLTMKLEQLAATIPDEEAARELNWFRKLMFELQEQERTRIAADLHDTTLQDLYFLKRRIMKVLDKYAYSPEDVTELHQLVNYIEVINMNLRQSCFELNPLFVKDTSLIQAIEKLIKLESEVCEIALTFHTEGSTEVLETLDFDRKRHIFRLIQELINNAKKHSRASKAEFRLTVFADSIFLAYDDNGVGFTLQSAGEESRTGFGLEQMKSRIYSLNGHFDLATAPGCGVQLKVQFPIQEALTA